jgi:hypothetical protein
MTTRTVPDFEKASGMVMNADLKKFIDHTLPVIKEISRWRRRFSAPSSGSFSTAVGDVMERRVSSAQT